MFWKPVLFLKVTQIKLTFFFSIFIQFEIQFVYNLYMKIITVF